MRDILHDWSDAESLQILQNLRKSMHTADCTLAIVEVDGPPCQGLDIIQQDRLQIHTLTC